MQRRNETTWSMYVRTYAQVRMHIQFVIKRDSRQYFWSLRISRLNLLAACWLAGAVKLMAGYLFQLKKKMRQNWVLFCHGNHSNPTQASFNLARKMLAKSHRLLTCMLVLLGSVAIMFDSNTKYNKSQRIRANGKHETTKHSPKFV